MLLAFDAPVDVKNLQGQTPLNEAISFGNRKMSKYNREGGYFLPARSMLMVLLNTTYSCVCKKLVLRASGGYRFCLYNG